MIIEPTWWEMECDCCFAGLPVDEGPVDESDLCDLARDLGWLIVAGYHFCSLDCLLTRRHRRSARRAMADATREHMASHATRCCRLHRTHAQQGRHDLTECVDPRWAGGVGPVSDMPHFPGWPTCERCGQQYGGSHYHCGNCDSTEVTSMYGHSHTGHWVGSKFVKTGLHFSCDPGACEAGAL